MPDNKSLKARVKEYCDSVGISMAQFEREANLSNGYFNQVKGTPGRDKLSNILNAFPDINREWLLYGEGEMLKTENKAPYAVNHDMHGTPYFDVDFVNGFDLVCNDQTSVPTYYIDFQQYNNADCWVNATGDSMKPLINHGDIIALKRLMDWVTYLLYGEIYAIVTDEFRTIKKVRKSTKGDDFLRLVPLNTNEFDEQDIPKDTIRSVFQVLGCAKKIF